ncbi:hypothetical protein C8R30_1536 [Nitrosomonas nitrosa]|nr:hypothetical protein C8R30_1536 [Nitrosomonas nitrosa]
MILVKNHILIFMLNTKQFAELNKVKPNTIYKRYSQFGSYWGITPTKLLNNRLLWPEKMIHKKPVTKHTQEIEKHV